MWARGTSQRDRQEQERERGGKIEIQNLASSPWVQFRQTETRREMRRKRLFESQSVLSWACRHFLSSILTLYSFTFCLFEGILGSSAQMSTSANCCNHKHTSHMTQLTPRRYLEKGRGRMERATERQEQCTMSAGGRKRRRRWRREEKKGMARDCEKEDI